MEKPIHLPHNATVTLKGYTLLNRSATSHYDVISVEIPWLDQAGYHSVGSSSNHILKTTPQYEYDLQRQHSSSLILTTLATHNSYQGLSLTLRVNKRIIPQIFDIVIRSGITGEPYTGLLFGHLVFQIN